MTTVDDIAAVLDELGITWGNEEVDPDNLPFALLVADEPDDTSAEDGVWTREMKYILSVVTEHRDYKLEQEIEDAFDAAGIPLFEKFINRDSQQQATEARYTIAGVDESTQDD